MRNLERAGVPRSAAMAMVGHQTESIYRRYAIADEAMLKEGALKLAACHAGEGNTTPKVVSLKKRKSENDEKPTMMEPRILPSGGLEPILIDRARP